MKQNRFDVFSSVMIAFITICSAITAWRASVASIQAGDADFDGIAASITRQEQQILNSITALEHYRAFVDYYRYNTLADGIDNDPAADAVRESSELWGLGLGLRYVFFPAKYLDRDDRFDLQRELDELWAESTALKDMDTASHFSRADLLRDKSTLLTGSLIVFAVAFFLFAFGQAVRGLLRYLLGLSGLLTTIAGILLVLIFEFSL